MKKTQRAQEPEGGDAPVDSSPSEAPSSDLGPDPTPIPSPSPIPSSRRGRWMPVWPGPVLVLVGIYFLAANMGLMNWVRWDVLWPVVIILFGLWMILRRRTAS